MNSQHPVIILGASFYGCGLAAAYQDALLLEPSILVGSDFALSYFPGKVDEADNLHPDAEKLRRELIERGALHKGRLHLAALSPLLSDWCLRRKLKLMLNTEIIQYDDNTVQILNIQGKRMLTAEKIIDARANQSGTKFLAAILVTGGCPAKEGVYGELELCHGALPNEAYVRLSLEEDCSWPEARRRFYSAWEKRPGELSECKFQLCGNRFGSYQFANPLAALSSGLHKEEA